MPLTATDWLVITGYLLINLLIGIYYRRRSSGSTEEFFVSGRNVSWWLAGTSMVATTFANVAMDLVESGDTGRMVAIQDGKYAHTHLPDPALGPRKVDVPVMYNAARFRPRYDGKLGDPMLLVGLD